MLSHVRQARLGLILFRLATLVGGNELRIASRQERSDTPVCRAAHSLATIA
jgi:hypothetical protein